MRKRGPQDVVEGVMRQLGFPAGLMGTDGFVEAILLCSTNPKMLHAVTKEVYPKIAKTANTSGLNTEHNMRTARDKVWLHGNRDLLNKMAGFELQARPSVGELLNYIVGYIRTEGLLDEFEIWPD